MKQPSLDLSDMLAGVLEGLQTSITSVHSYVPHPKQEEFHMSEMEMKLFIGGNRSGKTVANVVECIWRLIKKHPFRPELNQIEGPVKGRMSVVNFNDGLEKIVLPLFKMWMPASELIGRSWEKSYNKSLRTLTLANGSFIEFMSYDQDLDAFAGTSRHFVSFDEEPPMSIFNECMMRIIDTDGDWWISMTPVEGLTWIWTELYEPYMERGIGRDEILILEVSIHDNPHLSDKAKRKILGRLNEEERAAREEGNFSQISGRVYKTFDKNVHGIHDYEFKLLPSMRIYTSIDTGFRHPAAWLWHAVSPGGHIVTFHEIVVAEKTVEELAKMVLAYENKVREEYPFFDVYVRTGDPAIKQTREHTGTSVMQEYAKHGIYIGVEGVPRDVSIGVIKVTQYLNNKINGIQAWRYVREACPILESQMKNIHWVKWASKKMEYEKAPKLEIDKKDDDAPDSLRYFMTLMDDLTPEEESRALPDHSELIPSVPYASTIAPAIPDYVVHEDSVLVGLEG